MYLVSDTNVYIFHFLYFFVVVVLSQMLQIPNTFHCIFMLNMQQYLYIRGFIPNMIQIYLILGIKAFSQIIQCLNNYHS